MTGTSRDAESYWVSEQIERGLFGIDNPVLVSVLKFGLVWDVLAAVYVVLNWGALDPGYLFASALGLLWVNIAPFLIWYYDERVLPSFFAKISEILPDEAEADRLAEKYTSMFASPNPLLTGFWTIAAVAIIYTSTDVLQAQGMTGMSAPFLWTTYAYALFVGLVLSHGFMGPVLTVRLIDEVAALDLQIDPLHPDNLGGLSTVGYCAIRTTLLFSTGSLFLPLLFRFSAAGGSPLLIFGFTAIYIATILATFVYPTLRVNRRAQTLREAALDDLRERYYATERKMAAPDSDDLAELNRRLELQRIQTKYDNYNAVSLYPLQVSIIVRLIGSVVLPLAFMFVEFYLPKAV